MREIFLVEKVRGDNDLGDSIEEGYPVADLKVLVGLVIDLVSGRDSLFVVYGGEQVLLARVQYLHFIMKLAL